MPLQNKTHGANSKKHWHGFVSGIVHRDLSPAKIEIIFRHEFPSRLIQTQCNLQLLFVEVCALQF
jgi:hypothetical protein